MGSRKDFCSAYFGILKIYISILQRKLCGWNKKPNLSQKMALNPNYDQIGKAFTQQYYALFDDAAQRPQLVNLYNAEQSLMTFEGEQRQGSQKIMEKIAGLTFQKIAHLITAVDCQPTFDGGILINVLGQLKTDDDPPQSFTQTFVLKPSADSFFIQHDMFRLVIHNQA